MRYLEQSESETKYSRCTRVGRMVAFLRRFRVSVWDDE
jgi:ribosomal protein S14